MDTGLMFQQNKIQSQRRYINYDRDVSLVGSSGAIRARRLTHRSISPRLGRHVLVGFCDEHGSIKAQIESVLGM
jgi:hypothetical protein